MLNQHVRLSSAALLILAGAARGQALRETGAVSVQELLHPPSRQAFHAFQTARRLSDKGAHDKAADQLAKAVELSPYFSDAWINLAAQHLYLSDYKLALRELERAGQIAPPSAVMLSDRAFAQFALGRDEEGARSVREALRLDPSYAQAHYILGTFLARDRRTRTEGIAHLQTAAREIPAAREELERARQSRL